jgi:hypothetical protein
MNFNSLTPEMKQAIVEQMIRDAFSSKAIHLLGDNVAKGLHKLANATQATTDATAKWGGTAQIIAIPTIKRAAVAVRTPLSEFTSRVVAGARSGFKAATAR